MIDYRAALDYIDPSALTYQEWIYVGMGLKDASNKGEDVTFDDFDNWSRRDPDRYDGTSGTKRTWDGFKRTGITIGTVIQMAMNNGFKPLQYQGRELDWDFDIGDYDPPVSTQVKNLKRYVEVLFRPDEYMAYCLDSRQDKKGKFFPSNSGVFRRVGDLLNDLEKYPTDINASIGDYNTKAGGWVRINPFDGQNFTDEGVTDFRYCLIESDSRNLEEQLRKILKYKLPCAAIVSSGAKSIHAVMHVDASSKKQYKKRVEWIYKVLNDVGFDLDESNKNPSRFSRMPGLKRGENYQDLIAVNVGYSNFAEWEEFVQNDFEDLDLPEIDNLSDLFADMPPIADELIEGVLRCGHKMLLAGPSKAGKSFMLIELAAAIATGGEWLGFKCKKGKVLYINFEIDRASFAKRVDDVYEALGIDKARRENSENFEIWSLRGKAMPLSKLAPKIINRTKDKGYDAIVLDPIYKIQTGDENAAGDIGRFTNQLDYVVENLNCALIYCHHHSKGIQGFKRSIDRASGSGVFARDPDAVLDLIELDNKTYQNKEFLKDLSAWRLEGTLREFPSFKPVNLFFDYPTHPVDDKGILEYSKPRTDYSNEFSDVTYNQRIEQAFDAASMDGELVHVDDLATYLGVSKDTALNYIYKYNKLKHRKYYFRKKDDLIKKVLVSDKP